MEAYMANSFLPAEMADVRPELKSVVEEVERAVSYGSVLLSEREGSSITIDDRDEGVAQEIPTAGTVLTAFDGDALHERAIGGFDIRDIHRSASDLIMGKTFQSGVVDAGPMREGDFVTEMEVRPESLTLLEKKERIRDLHQRLRGMDDRLVNVRLSYLERNEFSVFVNRTANLAQRVQRIRVFIILVVADSEGNRRYDVTTRSGTGGWELLSFSDEDLDVMVEDALSLLHAERVEPGEYTVVTSPGVTGTIVHESFGHGVETDMFLKGRAKAAEYIGKQVGSPLVTIVDDPSLDAEYGSYSFDDEGWLSGPTAIVQDGVFRRGISDMYSAYKLGIPRSANGRRQDYTRKTYARMSNTFVERGETPVNGLFSQVDYGIYLEKWQSGMEDPLGWGIQVICRMAKEIKDGKLTGRVFSPVGMSGYVPEVLRSIQAVGDDLILDGGTCGKGHKEEILVGAGGPHLLMKARLG
jgi:TldD protein